MTRLAAALLALALLSTPQAAAAPAPSPELTSTVVPDATYGDGGSKQSVSNAARELVAEIWRDKNREIREQHEQETDGAQLWVFFVGEGSSTYSWGGAIEIKPIGGALGRWTMTVYGTGDITLKEYAFLTREELDREFAHWHDQMRGWVNGFLRQQQGGNG